MIVGKQKKLDILQKQAEAQQRDREIATQKRQLEIAMKQKVMEEEYNQAMNGQTKFLKKRTRKSPKRSNTSNINE